MVLCKGSAPTLATLWGVSTKGVGPGFGFADWELGIHHGRLPWTCEQSEHAGNYLSSSSALLRSCSRQSQDSEHKACARTLSDCQTTAAAAKPSEQTRRKPILRVRCELHGSLPLHILRKELGSLLRACSARHEARELGLRLEFRLHVQP